MDSLVTSLHKIFRVSVLLDSAFCALKARLYLPGGLAVSLYPAKLELTECSL